MKKHQIFLYFSLFFILGVAIRSFFNNFDLFYAFIILLAGIIFIIFNLHNKKLCIIFLGIVFLFLGILRFELSEPKINENHIAFYNNQQIEFVGKIIAEPDVREAHTKITVNSEELIMNNNSNKKIRGKILINAFKNKIYNYGEELKIKCNLKTPEIIKSDDWRDFDYGKYLAVKNIYSVCYKPKFIEKNDSEFTTISTQIYSKIFQAKQNFKKIIDKNLLLPESGLLNAMLLGYRQELSPEVIENFSKTGVSHLIAISGLHIAIIAGILFFFLMFLGISRQKSFWPGILILFLYILMIGFRASAVRAFLMGAILFYALKIGRLKNSLNALILSAVILLIINPKLLLFDIGFQLSFLAVFGILYFYQFFNTKWLKFIPDNFKIRSIISMTLSAQILTLPLVFYYFGVISFISPITNLLILPVLPIAMIFGIILILLGLIYQLFAFYFGFLVWAILKYIILVTELLAQIKFAFYK